MYLDQITNGLLSYGESFSLENVYTPEAYLNKKERETISGTVTGYGYYVSYEDLDINTPFIKVENRKLYDTIFNHIDTNGYWISDRGNRVDTTSIGYGVGSIYLNNGIGILQTRSLNLLSRKNGTDMEQAVANKIRPIIIVNKNILIESGDGRV